MTRTPSQDLTSGPAALWATLIGLGLATYGFYVLLLELGPEESVGPLYAACSASTAFLTLVMALDHQGYRRFIPAGTAISVSFACIVVFGLNWFDRSPAEDTQVGIFLAMGLAWFIAIPFAQAWAWGKRGADWYPALCGASWGNVQAIVLIGLFIAVAEAFLWLIGAIFDMIGLPFVLESVLQNKYAHPAIGILLAILAAQARMRLLSGGDDGWQKVTRLFAVLLVPATIAATAFIAALPFTGLAAIWSAAGGSGQLIGVAALLLLFLNAQYRDGRWMQADAPHRWALWSMGWAAALIAIFAGLAAYGVGLRIAQHGLSPARIWAGLAVGLLLIYGIGYSLGWFIASIRPGRPQFGWDRVNVGAALVVIGCLVVLSLPYSVPAALTAYHQLYRLESGAVSPRDFDAAVLDEGAIGPLSGWAEARYADWLKRHPDLAADAQIIQAGLANHQVDAALLQLAEQGQHRGSFGHQPHPFGVEAKGLGERAFVGEQSEVLGEQGLLQRQFRPAHTV